AARRSQRRAVGREARRRLSACKRAAGLLIALGQRTARGLLLRVFDGGKPRRALWLDPIPERLPSAAIILRGHGRGHGRRSCGWFRPLRRGGGYRRGHLRRADDLLLRLLLRLLGFGDARQAARVEVGETLAHILGL